MTLEEILAKLRQAIIDGDSTIAVTLTEEALAAGLSPLAIIQGSGTSALQVVGQKFQDGEAYLPELVLAARAMEASLGLLLPQMKAADHQKYHMGKIVIGTIVGDMHDIGKNIVKAMLSINGFEINDLGIDVPLKQFTRKAREVGAQIIGISSLLTTSMPYQRQLIQYAKDTNVRDQFYFIVGGGSVTPEWTKQIGADGWSRTAAGASELCIQLLEQKLPPPLPEPILVNK